MPPSASAGDETVGMLVAAIDEFARMLALLGAVAGLVGAVAGVGSLALAVTRGRRRVVVNLESTWRVWTEERTITPIPS